MIANKCCISTGVGRSKNGLPSFDKALLDAGVGNYNLVRLSSILPAGCEWIDVKEITNYIKEGSLLPVAYSTVTSDKKGDLLVSSIGVGIPVDRSKVGVIMEHSTVNAGEEATIAELFSMIKEAFDVRGWALENIVYRSVAGIVETEGVKCTTFACIAEW